MTTRLVYQCAPTGCTGTRVPMNYLRWCLGQQLQNYARPVINMTGFTGSYDFKLVFPPEPPSDADKSMLPPALLDRASLVTAVRKELVGLRLTPQKGSVIYLVVDHVERAAVGE